MKAEGEIVRIVETAFRRYGADCLLGTCQQSLCGSEPYKVDIVADAHLHAALEEMAEVRFAASAEGCDVVRMNVEQVVSPDECDGVGKDIQAHGIGLIYFLAFHDAESKQLRIVKGKIVSEDS